MGCGRPHETPCTQVLSLIDVYIDNEIDASAQVIVATHLQECPPCAGNVTVLQAVRAVVRRSAQPGRAPDGLSTRISASLQSVTLRIQESGGTDAAFNRPSTQEQ